MSGGYLEDGIFWLIFEQWFGGSENLNGEVVANVDTHATSVHPLPICTIEIETVDAKVRVMHIRVQKSLSDCYDVVSRIYTLSLKECEMRRG